MLFCFALLCCKLCLFPLALVVNSLCKSWKPLLQVPTPRPRTPFHLRPAAPRKAGKRAGSGGGCPSPRAALTPQALPFVSPSPHSLPPPICKITAQEAFFVITCAWDAFKELFVSTPGFTVGFQLTGCRPVKVIWRASADHSSSLFVFKRRAVRDAWVAQQLSGCLWLSSWD